MVTKSSKNSASVILNAASREIRRMGAGGIRVDSVATRAQLNKRLIYHYFGNKEGLVNAVYGLHSRRLLNRTNGLQDSTRRVLSHLIAGLNPVADVAAVSVDEAVAATELAEAIEIMLPVLVQRAKSMQLPAEITPEQWHVFTLELASLAFSPLAQDVFGAIPGDVAFPQVSNRLPTQPKPRYRLASATRTVGQALPLAPDSQ